MLLVLRELLSLTIDMDTGDKISEQEKNKAPSSEHNFFPKGAIAFFISLILFFAVVWLAIYALMIDRHFGA